MSSKDKGGLVTSPLRRVWRMWVAAGAVLALVVVGALLVFGGGGTPSGAGKETLDGTGDESSVSPQGDPEIQVKDKGFSLGGNDSDYVSYGFVVENPSEHYVRGEAATQLMSEAGAGQGEAAGHTFEFHLFPGQQVGLGVAPEEVPVVPAELEVTLEVEQSWDPADYTDPVLETSDVTVDVSDSGAERDNGTIQFAAVSEYDGTVDCPFASVLFRDSEGEIVGGAGGDAVRDDGRLGAETSPCEYPSGSSEHELSMGDIPPEADTSKAEVYLLPQEPLGS